MTESLQHEPYNSTIDMRDESTWSNGRLGYFHPPPFQQTPPCPFFQGDSALNYGNTLSQIDIQRDTIFNNYLTSPFDTFTRGTSWSNGALFYSVPRPRIVIPRDTSYGDAFSAASGQAPTAQSFPIAKSPRISRADGNTLASDTRKRKQTKP